MALRPLLLSAVVGIAALGGFHTPAAEAAGSFSVSIGTAPHYRSPHGAGYGGRYDHRYDRRQDSRHGGRYYDRYDRGGYAHDPRYARPRQGYAFVPGHWARGPYGRVWVPDQYVPVPGHDRRYGHGYDSRVIYRSSNHPQPLPGAFYDQRGGG
ncbi:MAG: hypothetical protein M3Q42_14885 [Pseudomonadota bacterium]|nr:hypothetical protein [Pseudomonadota bacterium]